MKNKKNEPGEGEGHRAHFAVKLKSTFEIDGKTIPLNWDCDLTVTFEEVDYMVRKVADGIAQAASKIARDGIGSKAAARSPEKATA